MADRSPLKVLALLGGRFLGHAHPLAALFAALRERQGGACEFELHLIPLSAGPTPPAATLLRCHTTFLHVHEDLAQPLARSRPIRDYCDLLAVQGLHDRGRQARLVQRVRSIIEASRAQLILTDSLPCVPQLAAQAGIPVTAIRSHALLQRSDGGMWRDVFLDEPLGQADIQCHRAVLRSFRDALGLRDRDTEPEQGVDVLFYQCPTATPGFAGFDVRPKAATSHVFFRLGSLPGRVPPRKGRTALLYVRDTARRDLLREILHGVGVACEELRDDEPSSRDLWNRELNAELILSHGGHGMVAAGLYQRTPHLVVADTDDRYTNGLRVERHNAGVCLDWRVAAAEPERDIRLALSQLRRLAPERSGLNQASVAPVEAARAILSWAFPSVGADPANGMRGEP